MRSPSLRSFRRAAIFHRGRRHVNGTSGRSAPVRPLCDSRPRRSANRILDGLYDLLPRPPRRPGAQGLAEVSEHAAAALGIVHAEAATDPAVEGRGVIAPVALPGRGLVGLRRDLRPPSHLVHGCEQTPRPGAQPRRDAWHGGHRMAHAAGRGGRGRAGCSKPGSAQDAPAIDALFTPVCHAPLMPQATVGLRPRGRTVAAGADSQDRMDRSPNCPRKAKGALTLRWVNGWSRQRPGAGIGMLPADGEASVGLGASGGDETRFRTNTAWSSPQVRRVLRAARFRCSRSACRGRSASGYRRQCSVRPLVAQTIERPSTRRQRGRDRLQPGRGTFRIAERTQLGPRARFDLAEEN